MKGIVICLLLITVSTLQAEEVTCPATRGGMKLTDAAFFEWMSASSERTMQRDRKTLMPDESRVDGEDWLQSWNVTRAVDGKGLQMVCKYQGVREGLFIEVNQKVSVCTLTKKSGVVTVGCK